MKKKIVQLRSKISYLAAFACMVLMSGAASATPVSTGDATNKAKSIADVLTYIFPLMGGFFVLAGLVKWVMAFRSEQPEQQASATKEIIIGIVCIVFKVFLWDAVSNIVF